MVARILPLLAFSLGSQDVQYREAVAATGQRTLELARGMSLVVEQDACRPALWSSRDSSSSGSSGGWLIGRRRWQRRLGVVIAQSEAARLYPDGHSPTVPLFRKMLKGSWHSRVSKCREHEPRLPRPEMLRRMPRPP
jgi:hypothetical protein